MWTHLGWGGGLVLMVAAGSGAPALGQSSMVANRADTGVILRPADGERVPPFPDGRTMLLKIGPTLTSSQALFIAVEEIVLRDGISEPDANKNLLNLLTALGL